MNYKFGLMKHDRWYRYLYPRLINAITYKNVEFKVYRWFGFYLSIDFTSEKFNEL